MGNLPWTDTTTDFTPIVAYCPNEFPKDQCWTLRDKLSSPPLTFSSFQNDLYGNWWLMHSNFENIMSRAWDQCCNLHYPALIVSLCTAPGGNSEAWPISPWLTPAPLPHLILQSFLHSHGVSLSSCQTPTLLYFSVAKHFPFRARAWQHESRG